MTSAVGSVGSTTILLFNGGATSSEGFVCLLARERELTPTRRNDKVTCAVFAMGVLFLISPRIRFL